MSKEVELLKWYSEAGVDVTLTETPINRLVNKSTDIKEAKDSNIKSPDDNIKANDLPKATKNKNLVTPNQAQAIARKLADESNNIDDLKNAVENFDGCSLKKLATNTVFSDGNPEADIMIIGEAPGANEDLEGIPFCGRSGKLLDNILASIGLSREKNIYITNTLFWRPPGNRRPTPEEMDICLPFVEKHVALIKPKIILLLGSSAVQSVLKEKIAMAKMRKSSYTYTNGYMDYEAKVFVTFHPSYLLRSPGQKKLVWEDMLKLQMLIEKE